MTRRPQLGKADPEMLELRAAVLPDGLAELGVADGRSAPARPPRGSRGSDQAEIGTYRVPSVVASVRCAGPVPRGVERAGSTPCARANASGSPGSGGRHQQVGGPPPCEQIATSTEPESRSWRHVDAASASALRRVASRRPDEARGGRCRAAPARASARRPRRRLPPGNAGTAGRAKGDPLDAGRSLRPARAARAPALRASAGSARARPARARPFSQLLGARERAEALEQPLDQVDLRLGERRIQPDTPSRGAVAARRLET